MYKLPIELILCILEYLKMSDIILLCKTNKWFFSFYTKYYKHLLTNCIEINCKKQCKTFLPMYPIINLHYLNDNVNNNLCYCIDILCYSFCLQPGVHQPSGTINMSRLNSYSYTIY